MLFKKSKLVSSRVICQIICRCVTLTLCTVPFVAMAGGQDALILRQARRAQEAKRPEDVVRWWLLNNSFQSIEQRQNVLLPDLRSVLWASIGTLGLCPQNLDSDTLGAGLWPIAMHNYLVLNLTPKKSAGETIPSAFDTFAKGKQTRNIAFDDVLSSAELVNTKIKRGPCGVRAEVLANIDLNEPLLEDARERTKIAFAMLRYLKLAKSTLNRLRVPSTAALDARIFDLKLFFANQKLGPKAQGLPFPEKDELIATAASWGALEWLELLPQRRQFLFNQVAPHFGKAEDREAVVLGVVDALIEQKQGSEVLFWLAFLDSNSYETRKKIWDGMRGERLLLLGPEQGFTARTFVALHRGISFFEQGQIREALRTFAVAVRTADENRNAEVFRVLARRWLSYLAGSYEVEVALVMVLREILPREDYAVVLQDLVWRAALRFDKRSFGTLMTQATGRQAWVARLERLSPLAAGNLGAFSQELTKGFEDDPHGTARFVSLFLDQLETEESKVRLSLRNVLRSIQASLAGMQAEQEKTKRRFRFLAELLPRCDSLLQGLHNKGQGLSNQDEKVRALNPGATVFAGNVRLAPSDIVPWPFGRTEIEAPSVFSPLTLVPIDFPANLPGGLPLGLPVSSQDSQAGQPGHAEVSIAGWRIAE